MQLSRVGALASFVLTVQFLLTLLWLLASWPAEGLAGLADAMAAYFLAEALEPTTFAAMNLYNVSFGLSAAVLAVTMRNRFSDYPVRGELAVYAIVVAAMLFVASGMIPLVGLPDLVRAQDASAVATMVAMATGLVFAATMCCGIGLALFAWVGFSSRRLPAGLCWLLLVVGLIELVEFAVPLFLLLDPLIGTCWSLWLGELLWRDRVAGSVRASRSCLHRH